MIKLSHHIVINGRQSLGPEATQHPSGAGTSPPDHPPSEDRRSARHLDGPGAGSGNGWGGA